MKDSEENNGRSERNRNYNGECPKPPFAAIDLTSSENKTQSNECGARTSYERFSFTTAVPPSYRGGLRFGSGRFVAQSFKKGMVPFWESERSQ